MTDPERRSWSDWLDLWLATRLLVRIGGRSLDLGSVPSTSWSAMTAPLGPLLTLVTAWNPRGREMPRATNRAANRRLRAVLDERDLTWRPALGRARDGSWAEPGFAVGGLDESAAAALGAAFDQLAVYVVTADELIVIASDRSERAVRARPVG